MDKSKKYPVMEHFPTLQGEGAHSGTAAYFIRLAGCDVGCHWCDVKDSWTIEGYPTMDIDELQGLILASGLNTAVITGGEPLMHDLGPLTETLRNHNIQCHIETSASHAISGEWDWITFSPKKFKAPIPETAKLASELKVVIFNKSDFAFAEKWASCVNEDCLLYLQPEWEKREVMMPMMVEYIKQNPRWRMSLQTHKYLNIP